jgi:hypothetical protein
MIVMHKVEAALYLTMAFTFGVFAGVFVAAMLKHYL